MWYRKNPGTYKIGVGEFFMKNPENELLERLADLIRIRNLIAKEIAIIIGRPAQIGNSYEKSN